MVTNVLLLQSTLNQLKVITIATHQDKYHELIKNGKIIETNEDKEAQLKLIF